RAGSARPRDPDPRRAGTARPVRHRRAVPAVPPDLAPLDLARRALPRGARLAGPSLRDPRLARRPRDLDRVLLPGRPVPGARPAARRRGGALALLRPVRGRPAAGGGGTGPDRRPARGPRGDRGLHGAPPPRRAPLAAPAPGVRRGGARR